MSYESESFQGIFELINVLEVLVYACKANVGNFIKGGQAFENHIAKLFGGGLRTRCTSEVVFDVIDQCGDLFR